jgi:hypothetical protein
LIVSAVENSLIYIDYETRAIKWILGHHQQIVPISISKTICAHACAPLPASDRATRRLRHFDQNFGAEKTVCAQLKSRDETSAEMTRNDD